MTQERLQGANDSDGITRALTAVLISGDAAYGTNTNADFAESYIHAHLLGGDTSKIPGTTPDATLKMERVLAAFYVRCAELKIGDADRKKILRSVADMLSYGQ